MTWTPQHSELCLAEFRRDMRRTDYCAPHHISPDVMERVMKRLRRQDWTLNEIADVWGMTREAVFVIVGYK